MDYEAGNRVLELEEELADCQRRLDDVLDMIADWKDQMRSQEHRIYLIEVLEVGGRRCSR